MPKMHQTTSGGRAPHVPVESLELARRGLCARHSTYVMSLRNVNCSRVIVTILRLSVASLANIFSAE